MTENQYTFIIKISENVPNFRIACEGKNIEEIEKLINKILVPKGVDFKESLAFLAGYWKIDYERIRNKI